jgi:hypothetical protein
MLKAPGEAVSIHGARMASHPARRVVRDALLAGVRAEWIYGR